jgi:hypothetical protein
MLSGCPWKDEKQNGARPEPHHPGRARTSPDRKIINVRGEPILRIGVSLMTGYAIIQEAALR